MGGRLSSWVRCWIGGLPEGGAKERDHCLRHGMGGTGWALGGSSGTWNRGRVPQISHRLGTRCAWQITQRPPPCALVVVSLVFRYPDYLLKCSVQTNPTITRPNAAVAQRSQKLENGS